MPLTLSRAEARRLLARYHFAATDLPGAFARLGSVQYDPLNPVGRNPDLVLQARVPGYHVDDWQTLAYRDRRIYDAWDKQVCLVPLSDWPWRAHIRAHRATWTPLVIAEEAAAVAATLAELDARGPLSSLDFADQSHAVAPGAWYGPKRVKHILRVLWDRGAIVTHHRQGGRHYYDRAERVIPPDLFAAPSVTDVATFLRWIVARRCQAMGLLRPAGDGSIWSGCGDAAQRAQALRDLVDDGAILPVTIADGDLPGQTLLLPASALPLLAEPPLPPRAIFVAPLDNLLWDRRLVQRLFDFDYIWEVYKPEAQRRWGYYVLPVFYGDRFIARVDGRRDGDVWRVARWWWEADVRPTADLIAAVRDAAQRFLRYLGATSISLAEGIDPAARRALGAPRSRARRATLPD